MRWPHRAKYDATTTLQRPIWLTVRSYVSVPDREKRRTNCILRWTKTTKKTSSADTNTMTHGQKTKASLALCGSFFRTCAHDFHKYTRYSKIKRVVLVHFMLLVYRLFYVSFYAFAFIFCANLLRLFTCLLFLAPPVLNSRGLKN